MTDISFIAFPAIVGVIYLIGAFLKAIGNETLDKFILGRQPAGRRIQPAQNLPFQYLRYLRILRHFPILAQNVHTTVLKISTDGRFVKIFMLSVFSLQ